MGTFQQQRLATRRAAEEALVNPPPDGVIVPEGQALTSIAHSVRLIELNLATIASTLQDIERALGHSAG